MEEIVGPQQQQQQVLNGVSVLAVADDINLVTTIQQMCLRSRYRFTTCPHGLDAFNLLSKSKDSFDVILVDDHLPDMDGYDFLHRVKQIINIPVIMTSVDETPNSVVKAIKYGACDYWIKPLQPESFRNIWHHVARKLDLQVPNNNERKRMNNHHDDTAAATATANAIQEEEEGVNIIINNNAPQINTSKQNHPVPPAKKTRIVWNSDLHAKFVKAVTELGIESAVPKKILALMDEPTLTREHIASHLQKFRIHLKKIAAEGQKNGAGGGGGVLLPSLAVHQQHFPFQLTASSSSIQWPNYYPSSSSSQYAAAAAAGEQTRMLPSYNIIPNVAIRNKNDNNILMMIQDGPTYEEEKARNDISVNAIAKTTLLQPPPPPPTSIYQKFMNSYNAAAAAASSSSAVSHVNHLQNYSGCWNSNNNNNSQVFAAGYNLQIQVPFPNLMIPPSSSPAGVSQLCSSSNPPPPAAAADDDDQIQRKEDDDADDDQYFINFNTRSAADQEDLHSVINTFISRPPSKLD